MNENENIKNVLEVGKKYNHASLGIVKFAGFSINGDFAYITTCFSDTHEPVKIHELSEINK